MGPSGSGKSTLLFILGLFQPPTAGEYRVSGVDVLTLTRDQQAIFRREMLGYVFQTCDLLDNSTVYENLELPLIYAGVRRRERPDRIREALSMMHAHNPPYYEDLVTSYGFTKTFDWYAYRISHLPYMDLPRLCKLRDTILSRNNCRILPIERKDFAKRGPEIKELFNDIWSKNWGHIPLTDRQFKDIFVTLQPLVRPDLESMAGAASSPVMSNPARCITSRNTPVPQPISSSRWPRRGQSAVICSRRRISCLRAKCPEGV